MHVPRMQRLDTACKYVTVIDNIFFIELRIHVVFNWGLRIQINEVQNKIMEKLSNYFVCDAS